MSDGTILYQILKISREIEALGDIEIWIQNFINPLSTKPTQSFRIDLYDAKNKLIGTNSDGITIPVVPIPMDPSINLTSSSDVVAD